MHRSDGAARAGRLAPPPPAPMATASACSPPVPSEVCASGMPTCPQGLPTGSAVTSLLSAGRGGDTRPSAQGEGSEVTADPVVAAGRRCAVRQVARLRVGGCGPARPAAGAVRVPTTGRGSSGRGSRTMTGCGRHGLASCPQDPAPRSPTGCRTGPTCRRASSPRRASRPTSRTG